MATGQLGSAAAEVVTRGETSGLKKSRGNRQRRTESPGKVQRWEKNVQVQARRPPPHLACARARTPGQCATGRAWQSPRPVRDTAPTSQPHEQRGVTGAHRLKPSKGWMDERGRGTRQRRRNPPGPYPTRHRQGRTKKKHDRLRWRRSAGGKGEERVAARPAAAPPCPPPQRRGMAAGPSHTVAGRPGESARNGAVGGVRPASRGVDLVGVAAGDDAWPVTRAQPTGLLRKGGAACRRWLICLADGKEFHGRILKIPGEARRPSFATPLSGKLWWNQRSIAYRLTKTSCFFEKL